MATVTQVAKVCNLTTSRISQLVKEGVIPREERGEYNMLQVVTSYIRFLQAALKSKGTMGEDGEVTTGRHQRNELLTIQTEREKLELAKVRGEVMSVSDMERVLADLVSETVARVMAVAPRCAPKVVGESSRNMVQAVMEKDLREALQGMADVTRRIGAKVVAKSAVKKPATKRRARTKTPKAS